MRKGEVSSMMEGIYGRRRYIGKQREFGEHKRVGRRVGRRV